MIEVKHRSPAGVDAVWNVLADGWLYPVWVVGAARVRAVSPSWPTVGAELHHSLGAWPFLLNDSTQVVSSIPKQELRLRGRGWPFGEVDIQLLLAATPDGGCEITMREDTAIGPARLLPKPIRRALITPRNAETLRRLSLLAERRAP